MMKMYGLGDFVKIAKCPYIVQSSPYNAVPYSDTSGSSVANYISNDSCQPGAHLGGMAAVPLCSMAISVPQLTLRKVTVVIISPGMLGSSKRSE